MTDTTKAPEDSTDQLLLDTTDMKITSGAREPELPAGYTTTFADRVRKVNKILEAGEKDGNYSADHKGYTGYKPQAVIDAVNSQFLGEWNIEVLEHVTYPVGEKKHAFVKTRVTLCGISMDSYASHPIQTDPGDAFKSAQTDAMKKAFAMFSIGNRAYHGKLEVKK